MLGFCLNTTEYDTSPAVINPTQILVERNHSVSSPIIQIRSFMCFVLDRQPLLTPPFVMKITYFGAEDTQLSLNLAPLVVGSTEVQLRQGKYFFSAAQDANGVKIKRARRDYLLPIPPIQEPRYVTLGDLLEQ